jgi:hypothetical protein
MESKYFTPDIEDIRIGYEYEQYHPKYHKNNDGETEDRNEWIKKVFGEPLMYGDTLSKHIEQENIRTPYLTNEQIEAEGWERLDFKREERYIYEKGNYFLVFNEKVKTINIILRDPSKESEISWSLQTSPERFKFFCECKCINTFRTICKLLNIK